MDKILKNPPCSKCPYKLGLVHTFENPCPECELNGYSAYKWLVKSMQKGISCEIEDEGLRAATPQSFIMSFGKFPKD